MTSYVFTGKTDKNGYIGAVFAMALLKLFKT